MEESYETFEEELWPPRADPPPQKPVRQISRPGGDTHTHRICNACAKSSMHCAYIVKLYKHLEEAATEI